MKKLFTILAGLLSTISVCGQTGEIIAVPLGQTRPTVMITLGTGISIPNTDSKNNAYLINSPVMTADVFIPLIITPKEGVNNIKHSFGFNAGSTIYFGGSANPSTPLPSPYNVTEQTSTDVTYNGTTKSSGFNIVAGPQMNFHFGNHFYISPILSAGYLSITQKEIQAVQTTSFNGETFMFNLTSTSETKISGFAFSPKIRLNYMFTRSIGAWIESSYTMGPKIKTNTTVLIPEGEADETGNYTISQLQNATYMQKETVSIAYRALGVNVGLVYEFRPIYPNPHHHGR